MTEITSGLLLSKIEQVAGLYHRLLLVVGPSGSGKTRALQNLAQEMGAPLVNLNLEVSRRLLELTDRQRALQLPQVLQDAVGNDGATILLDNTEILFDVSLKQDPLRLMQGLSRNRTVVVAWNGSLEGDHLVYATPEHPEFRRYPLQELVAVCTEASA